MEIQYAKEDPRPHGSPEAVILELRDANWRLRNHLRIVQQQCLELDVLRTESAELCKSSTIRQHGTLYLRTNPDVFRLYNFEAEKTLRATHGKKSIVLTRTEAS